MSKSKETTEEEPHQIQAKSNAAHESVVHPENESTFKSKRETTESNRQIPPTEPSQQIPPELHHKLMNRQEKTPYPESDSVLSKILSTDSSDEFMLIPHLVSSGENALISPIDPGDELALIPPTDPGDELALIPPTDPGDELALIPPTDPGDELALIPPTDPGDELALIPPSDPGNYFAIVDNKPDSSQFQYAHPSDSEFDRKQINAADVLAIIPPTEPKLQRQSDLSNTDTHNQSTKRTWLRALFDECVLPLKEFLKGKYATFALAIAMLYCYIMTTGQSPQSMISISDAIHWGANFSPKTNGTEFEWWRLLVSPYLHWDLSHITFNLGAFLLLALQIEHLLGTTALLCLFLTSSAFAGTATLMFYPNQVSMGASGGIYGIFGALLVLFILTKGQRVRFAKSITFFMIVWLFYTLASNTGSSQVDHASHFGGILSGFILGIFFAPLYKHQKQKLRIRLIYNLLPLCFTTITISIAWSLLPMPHPIFDLIEQYSVKAQTLHRHAQRFHTLEPLQQRALWDTEIRPLLQTLESKLIDSTEKEALVTRNEIKSVTQATQWTLKRLLNAWWTKFGAEFEAVPKSIRIKQKEAPPFEVIHDLYETMLHQHRSAQLIEPTWDERMKALEYYRSWQHLDEARQYLSQICAQLVNEASSAEVRAQGSLWAQAEVRLDRLKLIVETLMQRDSLSSRDIVTLTQIKWLNAQVEEVIRQSSLELRKPIDQQVLNKKDQIKLAKLLYQAVLAAPPTELGSELEFKLDAKGKLIVSKGFIPRKGQLFLSAKQCEYSQKNMEGYKVKANAKVLKSQSKSNQENIQLKRFIIEILPPKQPISDSRADQLNYFERNIPLHDQAHRQLASDRLDSRPKCLEEIKVITWFKSDEQLNHHSIWLDHPLD